MKQTTNQLRINLIDNPYFEEHKLKAQEWRKENESDFVDSFNDLKTGDTITFLGGFNKDIMYKSEIFGFSIKGIIYVVWDCYWFGISNSEDRLIQKV